MAALDLVEQLAQHKALAGVPRAELEWLAAHGTHRHLATGDVLTAKGTHPQGMFVILSGRIEINVDRGSGLQKVMEWRGGSITGMLPYSRLIGPPADTVAMEPTSILALSSGQIPELIRECHHVTSALVHVMVDRAKQFNASDLQSEKLASLGKLSAGIAHELNNPASAIERSAAMLVDRLDDAQRAVQALGALRLSASQLDVIDRIREACASNLAIGVRSPLEQRDREQAIEDWLADHRLDEGNAEALADTAVAFDQLDALAAVVQGEALDAVMRWLAAGCSLRGLASDIQESAVRISGLVSAIKGFTHMDRSMTAEAVNLSQSISNTVTVLRSKARAKSVAIHVELPPDLPPVHGFLGELNQIWANLLDNALDAVPMSGRIDVRAEREPGGIAVRIIDNGPGIPPDVRNRIFDPFFTTKDVGKGMGLGLDIVRRLVVHNDASIEVKSEPGRTEFRVVLPEDTAAAAR
jgi:signal transduction histidine kinase